MSEGQWRCCHGAVRGVIFGICLQGMLPVVVALTAAHAARAPVELFWYDGGLRPPRPECLEPDRELAEQE